MKFKESLMGLIFVNPNEEVSKKESVSFPETTTTFPEKTMSFPVETIQQVNTVAVNTAPVSCEPFMQKVMEMYEEGFNSLNQTGYDFYEYFKAVLKGGVTNPLVYQMALQMAQGMDSTVTKETLITQSDFYVKELEKVFNSYVSEGVGKKNSTIIEKEKESKELSESLTNIDKEIKKLTQEKEQKEEALRGIEGKYAPIIQEIDCKLLANETARNTLVGSIKSVVQGITTNIN